MRKICTYCGNLYDGRSDSRFCSVKCKNAYHNKKRNVELEENVSGLENDFVDDDENDYLDEDTDQNTDLVSENEDLKNVYDDDDDEEEEEDDEDENDYESICNQNQILQNRLNFEQQQSAQLRKRLLEITNAYNSEKSKRVLLDTKCFQLKEHADKMEQHYNFWYNRCQTLKNKSSESLKSFDESEEPKTQKDEFKDDFLKLMEL